jgi:hypothetical protein
MRGDALGDFIRVDPPERKRPLVDLPRPSKPETLKPIHGLLGDMFPEYRISALEGLLMRRREERELEQDMGFNCEHCSYRARTLPDP